MLKWRGLISSKGFIYFVISIITPFLGCILILQKIDDFVYAQDQSANIDFVRSDNQNLSMVFVGDAMFDRNVRRLMEQNGNDYPFTHIEQFIKAHEVAVINIEGVYTNNPSVSVVDNQILRFTFDPSGAFHLSRAGFDYASQANNHTSDFGREGAAESKKHLENNSLVPFGDFFNESEPVLIEKKGQKVALIGFNEFSYNNFEKVKDHISGAKEKNYFVVVFAHFGIEYEPKASSDQRELAHGFVDAGADLVIGAHPHVVEPLELYQNKMIFYSLGNFIFDQYFSKETQESIAISTLISNGGAQFLITPISVIKSRPEVASKEVADRILNFIAENSEVPEEIQAQIKNGQPFKVSR